MVKYYPLTRIKPNLYTRGDTYVLSNGKPYTGKYYLTYDGKVFTGSNPIVGTNQELFTAERPVSIESPISVNQSQQYTAAKLQNNVTQQSLNKATNNQQLKELQPYYPVVVVSDYQVGSFIRYFAKNISGPGYIFEISQGDYANIQNGLSPIDFRTYETTSMLWQLTGPLKDTRVSQYQIKGGVYDTNKRVTEQKALTFRGLIEFIGGEYTKFTKITP